MEHPVWTIEATAGPIILSAIHQGHQLRPEVAACCALSPEQRLQEEDPFTGNWIHHGDGRLRVHRSRFEVDMNRTLEHCVYQTPEQAWGLNVWHAPLPAAMVARSQALHQAFYRQMAAWLDELLSRHPYLAWLDIHAYNHRRAGPEAAPAPLAGNPDVDLLLPDEERLRWQESFDLFCSGLATVRLAGQPLTMGINQRFQRAAFGNWLYQHYGDRVFVLVVEFKKIFMDEWRGIADEEAMAALDRGIGLGVERLRTARFFRAS